MKEENKAPKNKWSAMLKKKWFLPSMYLVVAALLLSAVFWYQNVGNQVPEAENNQEATNEGDLASNPFNDNDGEAKSVMDEQEVIKMPVLEEEQAEIVTKFYDPNAQEEEQESALILYNNRFHQSTGIDIASEDGETFEATASISGQVKEVKEDPLLGNVVILEHDNDVTTYYSSLDDVQVAAGTEVKQGDLLGFAGKNVFGKDNGTHVHFEIRKDGQEVNPEDYFNQPVSKLDAVDTTEDADETLKEQDENNRMNEMDGLEDNPFGPEENSDEEEELDSDQADDDEDTDDSEEEDSNNA